MTSLIPEIRELDVLLSKHVGNSIKILKQETKYLTLPGENYGSIMLSVIVDIEDANSIQNTLHLVAKMIPINEMLKEIFQVQVTFIKELSVYTKIVPALFQLEEEYGIEGYRASSLFCKCYGGRSNLNEEIGTVDSDAMILFENLKTNGFENGDRLKGFDFESSKFVLRNLAKFHGVPIALKLIKPDKFKETVLATLGMLQEPADMDKEKITKFSNEIIAIITKATSDKHKAYLNNVCKNLKNKLTDGIYQSVNHTKPFVTFVHSDFWVNNMMIKRDANGNVVELKIVDFQTPQCQSLTYDVLFFMFSSIAPGILYEHIDELLHIYHDSFISCLQQFEIKSLQQYSFDQFIIEIQENARDILSQILFMYKPILLERGQISDMNTFTADDLFELGNITDDCKYRMRRSFEAFVEKGDRKSVV